MGERKVAGAGPYFGTPFLKAFSVAILVSAFAWPCCRRWAPKQARSRGGPLPEVGLLQSHGAGEDHFEPEELADRILAGDPTLLLVDLRTPREFAGFHLKGAVNAAAADLPEILAPHMNRGTIVLYSNGMTHPAQARDALARLGFNNVYLLTDGLQGFMERVLKPVSLREEIVTGDLRKKCRPGVASSLARPGLRRPRLARQPAVCLDWSRRPGSKNRGEAICASLTCDPSRPTTVAMFPVRHEWMRSTSAGWSVECRPCCCPPI